MSKRGFKLAAIMSAAGAVAGLGSSALAQPFLINISGATLQEGFFSAPASTREYLDINGGGVQIPGAQLAPTFIAPGAEGGPYQAGMYWGVQYYAVGSGNGLKTLIDYGRAYYTGADFDAGEQPGTSPLSYRTASNSYINRTRFVNGGAQTGLFNEAHGGSSPLRSIIIPGLACPSTNTVDQTVSAWALGGDPGSASPNSGLLIDIAPLDVPTIWFVRQSGGAPNFNLLPRQAGYGRDAILARNPDGTATTRDNLLESLDSAGSPIPVNLNAQDGSPATTPDCDSIFDTRVAFAPVAALVNYGVGYTFSTKTNLQYLTTTGRTETGENLVFVTRDSGSGTRNAFQNSLCIDPSWGVGENVGISNAGANNANIGPTFLPSNKIGSGDLETTVVNHRLSVGYSGAERGVASGTSLSSNWLGAGKIEVLAVVDNLFGRTVPAPSAAAFADYAIRPTIGNVVNNGLIGETDPSDGSTYTHDGYRVGGPATFVTLGDPRNANEIGGDVGNTNPRMRNSQAAAYMNNVTRSLEAFNADPNAPETDFTPGQLLGTRFVSYVAPDKAQNLENPCIFTDNLVRNQFVQDWVTQMNRSPLQDPVFAAYGQGSLNQVNGRLAGLVPTRRTTFTYSDGVTGGATNYVTQGGANVSYASQLSLRNKIAGDFSGDGVRDINDVSGMIAAWRERNGLGMWTAPGASGALLTIATANGFSAAGSDAIIEVLGDFNGDGNFGRIFNESTMTFSPDRSDVRYWADGLAISSGSLNRAAGFTAVDNAWIAQSGDNNFFGTTLATGIYAPGYSAADVAGSNGRQTPGYNPIGADGAVNASDIDYVYRQFRQNARVTDGSLNWNNLQEAVGADLSADITGDLVIDQADVDRIVQVVLATSYGDVNLDGVCDSADLAIANSNLGNAGGWAMGDVNGDGSVTAADITLIAGCINTCPCDINNSGTITSQDFFDFITGFFNGTLDYNADGNVTSQDYFDFLACFFAPPMGC